VYEGSTWPEGLLDVRGEIPVMRDPIEEAMSRMSDRTIGIAVISIVYIAVAFMGFLTLSL
jgi:hypothetical protein